MGGASPRPAMRRLLRGRQRARGRGCCIQGIRSLEPLGPKLPIRAMRVPRRRPIEGGSPVPACESTRSTWNACGGLGGLPSVDDRRRFARRGSALAVPAASCKRVRGAARWSPWPTRTKSRRRLTARREDFLGDSPGAISRAARRRAMPALERVTSALAASGGVFTRTLVEVELLAMWVRAQQGGGIRTPRRRRLEIAREAGGGRSTWNVYGDVRPKAGDVRGGRARGGRIADQRRTLEATTGARIPA
jgi:hypothetical protein